MKISVTLRYLSRSLINITKELEVPTGLNAGELSEQIIRDEEEKEGLRFSGASIVILVNGQIASPDHILQSNDNVQIMPVAAAG